ncbi:metal ABC transporter permease [Candidatus Saccharibacteria bacterium]|nr:metal ABC transporter permease [Candidatus Saccharibacteria bacterium]
MIFEMLSHAFIWRALIAGVLIAICSALIGTPLVLRRNATIGDGLAHTAFGIFALFAAIGFVPHYLALPLVIIASFLVLRLNQNNRINGDSAIALLSASSFAIGTFAISLGDGINIDLNSYLFGSILAVNATDLILSATLAAITIYLFVKYYRHIFAITFDPDFARSLGLKLKLYDAIFAILCSCVVVLGMRLLGSLLISSLIIFPTLTAMQVTTTFKHTLITAIFLSISGLILGMILSYILSTPSGASIVIVHLGLFLITFFASKLFAKSSS